MEDDPREVENLVNDQKTTSSSSSNEEETHDDNNKEGYLGNLIHNLLSPSPRAASGGDHDDVDRKIKRQKSCEFEGDFNGGGGGGDGGEGGVVGNMLSNLFHKNGGGDEEINKVDDDDEKREIVDEVEVEEAEVVVVNVNEDSVSGGGIISNIISNLSYSLPDDAAPSSDEASILIHSIIHD
ncbi:hypothetical protein ACFE04_002180 [Oxalis oulophora]